MEGERAVAVGLSLALHIGFAAALALRLTPPPLPSPSIRTTFSVEAPGRVESVASPVAPTVAEQASSAPIAPLLPVAAAPAAKPTEAMEAVRELPPTAAEPPSKLQPKPARELQARPADGEAISATAPTVQTDVQRADRPLRPSASLAEPPLDASPPETEKPIDAPAGETAAPSALPDAAAAEVKPTAMPAVVEPSAPALAAPVAELRPLPQSMNTQAPEPLPETVAAPALTQALPEATPAAALPSSVPIVIQQPIDSGPDPLAAAQSVPLLTASQTPTAGAEPEISSQPSTLSDIDAAPHPSVGSSEPPPVVAPMASPSEMVTASLTPPDQHTASEIETPDGASGPTDAERGRQIQSFINHYDGGPCFFAAVQRVSSSSAEIDSFSPLEDTFRHFDRDLKTSTGFEATVSGQRIWKSQCPTVALLRKLSRDDGGGPSLALDRRNLHDGDTLSGTVQGTEGLPLNLFVISENGTVDDVSTALSVRNGTPAFSFRPRHPGTGGSFPQILVAVVGTSASATRPGSAADLFQPLVDSRSKGRVAAKLFLLSH